jgi:hypothetical protein
VRAAAWHDVAAILADRCHVSDDDPAAWTVLVAIHG